MSKNKIAVVQSNYIPWKGYFDLIRSVDTFVLYDEVQYTKRDYRNRNTIKTGQGLQWLTIPVSNKGKYLQKVCETEISEPSWGKDHLKSIQHNYAKAPHFKEIFPLLQEVYAGFENEISLSKVNERLIRFVLNYLECPTQLVWSMDIPKNTEGKNERLIEVVSYLKGDIYLSGPAAQSYMDVDHWAKQGIEVRFADYSGYPPYTQLHGEFVPNVSVLDLLFNQGKNSTQFMKRMLP